MSYCCGRIFRSYRFTDCKNIAKVERDGKSYCGIHDPVAVKARDDKTKARWEAERIASHACYVANTAARNRAELCVAACSTLTDNDVSTLGALLSKFPETFKNILAEKL